MKIDWPVPFRYRAPQVSYERLPGLLRVKAVESISPLNLVVTAGFLVSAIWYAVAHRHALNSHNLAWIGLVFIGSGWSFYTAWNPDHALLEINIRTVRFQSRVGSTELDRLNIGELHFLAGDGKDVVQGLYSSHGWSHALLMPYVTEEQVFHIKDEIYSMFPDTPSGSTQNSDLITLGLNR
ncbi:hypothetical protein [Terriglobus sp. TAA 43]|uniref:hypothetical protein n=1 Tax=Terriglobus sp. TAA 43 TaxID=278961 RepID=UPI0006475C52|nr:hypothetical protein [Terriglobus sp. TAA 43]